jgi:RNA polymerase-binding transcription factor DksA
MTDSSRIQLEVERVKTLARLGELTRELGSIITATADGAAGGDDEHDPEGATVAYERQHVAALLARTNHHLTDVNAALRKFDQGRYGFCDGCGLPIGAERLRARPAALTCIRCAARRPGPRG